MTGKTMTTMLVVEILWTRIKVNDQPLTGHALFFEAEMSRTIDVFGV